MPEDTMKSTNEAEGDRHGAPSSLDALRDAALNLGLALKSFGKHGIPSEEDDGLSRDEMLRKGRDILLQVERRLARMEHAAEDSVREHPRPWLAGLLAVVGIGLLMGMVLQRRR